MVWPMHRAQYTVCILQYSIVCRFYKAAASACSMFSRAFPTSNTWECPVHKYMFGRLKYLFRQFRVTYLPINTLPWCSTNRKARLHRSAGGSATTSTTGVATSATLIVCSQWPYTGKLLLLQFKAAHFTLANNTTQHPFWLNQGISDIILTDGCCCCCCASAGLCKRYRPIL